MLRRPRKAINKKQKGRTNYNIRVNQLRMGGAGTTLPTAILSKEAGEITASQISAMEYVVKRVLKKSGFSSMAVLRSGPRYVLRLFPHRPRSKKPNETGLGRGKGPINSWVTRVKKGQILLEFDSYHRDQCNFIAKRVNSVLPVKCQLIVLEPSAIKKPSS